MECKNTCVFTDMCSSKVHAVRHCVTQATDALIGEHLPSSIYNY